MKRFFLILICSFLTHITYSQNPGLLGKHYNIYYNFDYQIGIVKIGDMLESDAGFLDKIGGFFNGRHELENEIVISRWQSLNAAYSFARGIRFDRDINYLSHEINLGYKAFSIGGSNSSIAPLGYYYKPEIMVLFSKYKYNGADLGNFMHYGAGIEFGRQSVVFKKFLLNIGMSIGYIHYTKKEVDSLSDGYDTGFSAVWNNSPYKDMLIQKLFSFKVGIGLPVK